MTHLDLNTQAASGGEMFRRAQMLNAPAQAQRPVLPVVRSLEQDRSLPRRPVERLEARGGERQSAGPASQSAFYGWIGLFMGALVAAAAAISWVQLP